MADAPGPEHLLPLPLAVHLAHHGRQIAGEAEQRRALADRLEAQRDTFIEHMRRQARAQEESHRRMIEDMERDIRISRQLLVRLSEQTDESEQEQPL